MANLILTQTCNKNCSYCFARQFRFDKDTKTSEMSLETISSILDKLQEDKINNVSLLGGEPTEHPQFEDILNLCIFRKFKVLLISNFLFSKEIREVILKNIEHISFLANTTELRVGNRMEIFAANYNALQPYSKQITCGFTLDGELLAPDGFDSYLDFIGKYITLSNDVRLSISFPGDAENKENFSMFNYELGDMVYYAIRRILYAGATPRIDCITFPCIFRSDKIRAYVEKYDERKSKYVCQEAPSDYFPDGTVRYCFPTLSLSLDSTKYRSDSGIRSALKRKYEAVQRKLALPEMCAGCTFFKAKSCQGPCLGFRHFEV